MLLLATKIDKVTLRIFYVDLGEELGGWKGLVWGRLVVKILLSLSHFISIII